MAGVWDVRQTTGFMTPVSKTLKCALSGVYRGSI